jgi:cystathionine gamma-synthase
MAATMTVLQTLSPGDHVVVADDTYFGTREIFRDLFFRWGVETSFVDMTNAEEVGGPFGRARGCCGWRRPRTPA